MANTNIESRRVGPWPGGWNWVDGELGVGPDELWEADNVVLGDKGEVRKRPGFGADQSTNHPAWNALQLRHWQLRQSNGDYYDIVLDAAGTYYATVENYEQDFIGCYYIYYFQSVCERQFVLVWFLCFP